jgi:pimeloyl-ACP methyl ester carboxylesterase
MSRTNGYDTMPDEGESPKVQEAAVPTIDRDFGEMYFRVRGRGSHAVVLLHDFFGTHRTWNALQMQLSRYFLVIAPDLRGHGKSTVESGDLSISAMSGDIKAILDHMGVPRTHLIGCSHGAVIAMHMARTMAERVESIVVTSIPDLNEPEVIAYGHQYAASVFPRLEEELDELHGGLRQGYSRDTLLASFVEAIEDPPSDHRDAVNKANEITCPVLMLSGDSDPVMSAERALALMRRIPEANLGMLPDTSHLAHQESPAMYTEAVLDHLWRYRAR